MYNVTVPDTSWNSPYSLTAQIIVWIIIVILSLETIIGNAMVILAYRIERNISKQVSNRYIVSLAISDLIIGIEGFPLFTVYVLNETTFGPLEHRRQRANIGFRIGTSLNRRTVATWVYRLRNVAFSGLHLMSGVHSHSSPDHGRSIFICVPHGKVLEMAKSNKNATSHNSFMVNSGHYFWDYDLRMARHDGTIDKGQFKKKVGYGVKFLLYQFILLLRFTVFDLLNIQA
ncbi:unnamed protein product [Caenorhabditis auriculariae]|uniref:G-protein coupled receptors family 1 profile domain-containing protein n=1 Tax=Caenorhabditis auriculariae TaxID=2777116 RepID=A0A8S1GQJ2_9PELO|nr:unnamed protein product [Caenorhabditis auriculariae]